MAMQVTTIRKSDLMTLAKSGPIPAISPLGKLPEKQSPLTADARKLAQDPAFSASVELLARPAWLITLRMGGGDWPVQEMCLCGRDPAMPLAGVRPADTEHVEVIRWDSAEAFVSWWCGQYAQKSEEIVPNFIPPTCPLASFLMILQALDAYRRALMGSMLNHQPPENLQMSAQDFTAVCQNGMRNRDVRWLAPAFVVLVPGFGELHPSGGPETLKAAYDRGFLTTVLDSSGKEERIGFGEAGRSMGLEFARTWLMGAGLEARIPSPEGTRALSRCFIAPTGLTNHHVSLVPDASGTVQANHQPLTAGALAECLLAMIKETAVIAVAPPPQVQTGVPDSPSAKTGEPGVPSPQIGGPGVSPMQPEAQTLSQAQTAQETPPAAGASVKFCAQCGAKMAVEMQFCAQCGARQ